MVTFQKTSSTSLFAEPGSPDWAQRMVGRLLAFFQPMNPIAPNHIWYVLQAGLPPAADWPGCIVVVVDQQCLGVSDGTNWRRINMGAPL